MTLDVRISPVTGSLVFEKMFSDWIRKISDSQQDIRYKILKTGEITESTSKDSIIYRAVQNAVQKNKQNG